MQVVTGILDGGDLQITKTGSCRPVQFVVDLDGDVDVWGQDSVGFYDGELRGGRLILNYVSSSPDQAMRFVLTRR